MALDVVRGIKMNIVEKRLKDIRPLFFLYSFFTTVIIYSVFFAMISRDDGVIFDFQTFFMVCPYVFIGVMFFGVPIAITIDLIMSKLKIKSKMRALLLETILYLTISMIGTFLTLLLIFRDFSMLIQDFIFGDGIFLHIFGAPLAILFQISLRFFRYIYRVFLKRKYRSVLE